MTVDPEVEQQAVDAVRAWRAGRDAAAVDEALRALRDAAKTDGEPDGRDASQCARVGVTTGEWAGALREVFGEYRAPTGVSGAVAARRGGRGDRRRARSWCGRPARSSASGCASSSASPGSTATATAPSRSRCAPATAASRSSTRASGSTPAQIVAAAVEEDVHVIGLSILSGSHMEAVPAVLEGLRAAGAGDVPVVVGGIIPESDARAAARAGRRAGLHAEGLLAHRRSCGEVVGVVREANGLA